VEYILKNNIYSPDWIFVVSLFILCYITFIRVHFGKSISLIFYSTISRKYSNQFFRESNNQSSTYLILPIFVLVSSLLMTHPFFQKTESWDSSIFFNFVFFISLFLLFKFFINQFIATLFEVEYLFEQINYHTFIFEKVGGIFLFPFVLLATYSPYYSDLMFRLAVVFLCLIFVVKCVRLIYLSFFKTSFSKTHIIVYLCTLEILPLLLFIYSN
jgi:hypothetical protein